MDTLDAIGRFVNNVGFPVAFVIGTAIIAWRIGVFLAPIVQRIANAHVGMIETIEKNDTEKTTALSTQSAILKEHTEILTEIRSEVRRKA